MALCFIDACKTGIPQLFWSASFSFELLHPIFLQEGLSSGICQRFLSIMSWFTEYAKKRWRTLPGAPRNKTWRKVRPKNTPQRTVSYQLKIWCVWIQECSFCPLRLFLRIQFIHEHCFQKQKASQSMIWYHVVPSIPWEKSLILSSSITLPPGTSHISEV